MDLQLGWLPKLSGTVLLLGLLLAPAAGAEEPGPAAGAVTLPNGIQLPTVWPPHYTIAADNESAVMAVPYLEHPPAVIPIDVGRQLFVDDFLIEETTLTRSYHQPRYVPENPVLRPDRPWEKETVDGGKPAPTAMVFSDGVWYDPKDECFKMWYMGGHQAATCLARSKYGIHWEKPALDVVPGTNIVSRDTGHGRGSTVVWLDLAAKDPKRRYVFFSQQGADEGDCRMRIQFSADGIHWKDDLLTPPYSGDRSTAFYNPLRDVWVFSIKQNLYGRRRKYAEVDDLRKVATAWRHGDELPVWVGADRLDLPHPDMPEKKTRELYNLDANGYESLLLGLFTIYPGKPKHRPKVNQVFVGFSRDGFHWYRPDRRPFLPVSDTPGAWNYGNVQSAGGCCLVVDDQLYFYCSGRAGYPDTNLSGACSTGLATLRRDGFASLDAGAEKGQVTTRPLRFQGKHLWVNLDASQGELRAEVLDEQQRPIAPFTLDNCLPVRADSTRVKVGWKNAPDLSALAGKTVRLRFTLTRGSLYAFWVSPEASGASHGYVAAGGPGFTGPTDTVGRRY